MHVRRCRTGLLHENRKIPWSVHRGLHSTPNCDPIKWTPYHTIPTVVSLTQITSLRVSRRDSSAPCSMGASMPVDEPFLICKSGRHTTCLRPISFCKGMSGAAAAPKDSDGHQRRGKCSSFVLELVIDIARLSAGQDDPRYCSISTMTYWAKIFACQRDIRDKSANAG